MRSGSPSASLDADAVERILSALAEVPDPEIPVVSVIDLGIVRGVETAPPGVIITPTYSGCPATQAIEMAIRAALDRAGFRDVPIRTALAPAWTTDWINERGRERLKRYGIAPPSPRHSTSVECPCCGSNDTQEVSRFGSTPCKALWRCRSCLEPFDLFKCH
jgi:ring-1,2-phenylacetyl-CoA epoxidase subunit PaaD